MKSDKIIIVIIIALLVALLIFLYASRSVDESYDLRIYFFNAGKADAILISKNDKYMMIDTGEQNLSKDIINYFKKNNITKLDYLIITHFDKDHVGSASKIIDSIEVDNVLQSNYPKESEYYNNYLTSLKNKNIDPITISGDYEISLSDLEIVVNGPDEIYDSNESNNSSLITTIKYKDNKYLFMGDAQNARIKDFLNNNNEEYDFLKVPYHGNYLKRLDNLLETKNIKYAVMTCSKEEGCEDETVEMLNKYNIKYYLTSDGSITVLSNGKDIKIEQ
ncbi:MAG: MBL fold metallo-hydrolase [Bacilli bacterium]|nr:MBL fold metallo-hydrolase [Bacilli bacterium]